MVQVEAQHYACEPEASHGHGVEPCASRQVGQSGRHHTDETQNVEYLKPELCKKIWPYETTGGVLMTSEENKNSGTTLGLQSALPRNVKKSFYV